MRLELQNPYFLRRIASTLCAIFIALLARKYASFSYEYWVVLAAFLVTITTRGTPIRQGMIIVFLLIAAVVFSALLHGNIQRISIIEFMLAVFFVISGYVIYLQKMQFNKLYWYSTVFSIIFILSMLMPSKPMLLLQDRILDIMLGAVIGLMSMWLILPANWNQAFKLDMIPVMNTLQQYAATLENYLFAPQNDTLEMQFKRYQLEECLQPKGSYPEWVYEVGFNYGLRSGFRYFLIHFEQAMEVFYSIEFLADQALDLTLLNHLHAPITKVMRVNQELMTVIMAYFSNKKHVQTQADYTSDIDELEKNLHQLIPNQLEFLDISPHYLALTALVRDFRDLRHLLLQLVFALQ
jgi:hypothetical protein